MANYDLNTMTVQDYETLMKELAAHAQAYYVNDAPTISDNEYDALYRIARKYEEANPSVVLDTSIVAMDAVVADLDKSPQRKIAHSAPMLSLDNAMNEDEALQFYNAVVQACGKDVVMEQEYKYDGLGLSVLYINRKLVQALTRGTGEIGEDVLLTAKHITNVPHTLPDFAPDRVEIRGEVLMAKSRLEALNAKARERGERELANVRNAAAGALRALEPSAVIERQLFFRAYSCPNVATELPHVKRQSELLTLLQSYGFVVEQWRTGTGFEFIKNTFDAIAANRDELDFAIDGVVFKVDEFEKQERMGWRSRVPNFAKAYKFQAEQVKTKLLAIDVQIGKSGQVTPVARVQPVFVGGVEVSNVTLATLNSLTDKGVRVGDTVIVRRAGEVIPEIIGYDPEARPADSVPYDIPDTCPHCGSAITRERQTTLYFCRGGSLCEPQRVGKLIHYASRESLNIEGLGKQTCYQLHNAGMLDSFADIYKLEQDKVAKLSGFGVESAKKLLAAINNSRKIPLDKFIYALSIDNVGSNTSKIFAKAYGSFEVLRNKTAAELECLTDVGPLTAQSASNYFAEQQEQLDELLQYVEVVDLKKDSNKLEGMTFVITGTLSQGRDAFKALIESHGGKVSSGVSKKTTYLLAGEGGGDKQVKAEALGVTVLNEAMFLALLN